MSGRLRQQLMDAADALGVPMKDLTVLAAQNDPYRIDTDANHRDGQWLATQVADLIGGSRTVHLRGLHYAVIGRAKPNGNQYTNTDADWQWLSNTAAKAARWLGYLPFTRVVDQRNSSPSIVKVADRMHPQAYVTAGFELEIPDAADLHPQIGVIGFAAEQPYRLVFFGEKSSLEPVLGQVAETYGADLYLPTGEISDTLLHTMASHGAADGRPMVVFCFSDCDPSGWQMPISIGHKLGALQSLLFPNLAFEVRQVGLLPEHVRRYGLPSTPLKETEKRADKWRAAQGVAQTEIDALAALRPGLLRTLAEEAIKPFYDHTLRRRVADARYDWLDRAQQIVDSSLDTDLRQAIHARATETLDDLRAKVSEIEQETRIDISEIQLPEVVIPSAEITVQPDGDPLVTSKWDFAERVRALIAAKNYERGGAA